MFKKVLLVCCTCCALLGCSTEEKIELEWITENAPIPKGLKDYALKSHDEHFYNLYNLKTAEDLKNFKKWVDKTYDKNVPQLKYNNLVKEAWYTRNSKKRRQLSYTEPDFYHISRELEVDGYKVVIENMPYNDLYYLASFWNLININKELISQGRLTKREAFEIEKRFLVKANEKTSDPYDQTSRRSMPMLFTNVYFKYIPYQPYDFELTNEVNGEFVPFNYSDIKRNTLAGKNPVWGDKKTPERLENYSLEGIYFDKL